MTAWSDPRARTVSSASRSEAPRSARDKTEHQRPTFAHNTADRLVRGGRSGELRRVTVDCDCTDCWWCG
jgi:hypothetical protein